MGFGLSEMADASLSQATWYKFCIYRIEEKMLSRWKEIQDSWVKMLVPRQNCWFSWMELIMTKFWRRGGESLKQTVSGLTLNSKIGKQRQITQNEQQKNLKLSIFRSHCNVTKEKNTTKKRIKSHSCREWSGESVKKNVKFGSFEFLTNNQFISPSDLPLCRMHPIVRGGVVNHCIIRW